jgi:hypothetical protein
MAMAANDPIADISPRALLILMIFRWLSLTLPMAFAGCSQPTTSSDLCQMPPHFQSWHGAEVRWHGAIVETFHHGHIFVSDHCVRSIVIEMNENDPRTIALRKTLRDNWTNRGLIVATVTGKLHREEDVIRLRLSNFDGLVVRPMSEIELDNWYIENNVAILQ